MLSQRSNVVKGRKKGKTRAVSRLAETSLDNSRKNATSVHEKWKVNGRSISCGDRRIRSPTKTERNETHAHNMVILVDVSPAVEVVMIIRQGSQWSKVGQQAAEAAEQTQLPTFSFTHGQRDVCARVRQ